MMYFKGILCYNVNIWISLNSVGLLGDSLAMNDRLADEVKIYICDIRKKSKGGN